MSYNTVNGQCAGAYPVAIPNVSMHGDVFLAWDNVAMGQRVKDCVVQKAKCNTAGTF
ncbi:hypothetical protein KZZ52_24765 [Dactylosporangium sp. AC04546]|uniref:hypothetical protein n=1 Tax=Dactylosporangium sp. AC04546 TaxID=2862460 RepID=UPI001EE03BB4|nr:hypothetical protein [Dactylosporangium sp. AC04546]WVK89908.1 hypothetical protein KZZ52_24765 [Dactylosporangium sp. AC04546]